MMAAIAGVRGVLRQLPKLADFSAFRAAKVVPKPQLHKVVKAGFIGRKALEKVLNCEGIGHG
jgi:hypothetical protein